MRMKSAEEDGRAVEMIERKRWMFDGGCGLVGMKARSGNHKHVEE